VEDFDAYICLPSGDLMAIYMVFHRKCKGHSRFNGIPWDLFVTRITHGKLGNPKK